MARYKIMVKDSNGREIANNIYKDENEYKQAMAIWKDAEKGPLAQLKVKEIIVTSLEEKTHFEPFDVITLFN